MRGALTEHPKVIAVARALQKNYEFRDWLTPGGGGPMNGQILNDSALRCVTCALLLRVWSKSREHGEFVGDDLVLRHNCITDLDQMAGAPGVGKAMQSVGWAIHKNGVTLPDFITYNVPMTNAEKQRAYRERGITKPLPSHGNKSVTRTETEKNSVISDHKNKRSEYREQSTERVEISTSDAKDGAADLFRRTGYSGDDGRYLWKAAAAVFAGLLNENMVVDAAQGCREVTPKPTNPVAYFRKSLSEIAARYNVDSETVLKSIHLTPNCPKTKP